MKKHKMVGFRGPNFVSVNLLSANYEEFMGMVKILRNLGGKYAEEKKAWIFKIRDIPKLEEAGVFVIDPILKKKYPEAVVNRERVPFIRDYQEEPLQFILSRNGRALLADDVGLGKTLTSIAYFAYTRINYPLLIITTSSTKYQWEYEYNRFNTWQRNTQVLEGIDSLKHVKDDTDVVILNYDILSRHVEKKGKKGQEEYFASDDLVKFTRLKFQGLILDECQKLKSLDTLWTKAVQFIAKDIPYVLALSASPIENRPKEFFPVLNILRPDLWPDFYAFGIRYCAGKRVYRTVRLRNGKSYKQTDLDFNGVSNWKELHDILKHNVMFRRTKHETIKGLPKATPITQPIKLNKKQKEYYNSIIDGTVEALNKNGEKIDMGNPMLRKNHLKMFAGEMKLPFIIKFLEEFLENSDEKIVVFTEHHAVIDALHNKFKKESVIYDGRLRAPQKEEAKIKFTELGKRIIFGQISALGEGVDGLQKVCSKMMIAELPYNPMRIVQAIGRLERIGSTSSNVSVYFPILLDTIEEEIMSIITDKTTSLLNILDGDSKTVVNIGSQITKHLESLGLDTE